MHQNVYTLQIKTQGRKLYDITTEVQAWVGQQAMQTGLLTLCIQHTSASLLINENYDSDVLTDMQAFFNRLVPDGDELLIHTVEGPDDMPAHIRTALTQTSLSIPIIQGQIALGQWQGIFLFEHRLSSHERRVVIHSIGE